MEIAIARVLQHAQAHATHTSKLGKIKIELPLAVLAELVKSYAKEHDLCS